MAVVVLLVFFPEYGSGIVRNPEGTEPVNGRRIRRDLIFDDRTDCLIFYDTSFAPDRQAEPDNDVVDTVAGGGGFLNGSITFRNKYAQFFDPTGWKVGFRPDTSQVMQGEHFRIQDICFPFRCACNRRIDDAGRTFPGEKNRHMVSGFDAVVEGGVRQIGDRGRTDPEDLNAPVLCMDKGISVDREFMAVLKEFQIPFHINANLDKPGMAVDPDAIGFHLLNLDPFFKNDSFAVMGRIRHRNTLERVQPSLRKMMVLTRRIWI